MRAAGLEPDPWQVKLLLGRAPRALLLCSRQSGKSTVVAAIALHEAITQPHSLILLLSPALRQSGELFGKVSRFYQDTGRVMEATAESALQIRLENGSRIVSLPGKEKTVRSFSGVDLLVIDEAARVPDELYFSVRPMLAVSGGRLIGLSTPFGKRGWFHKEWTEGGPGWERFEVKAQECPRITPEFLEEERRSMGDWWFSQEYQCMFVEGEDQLFAYEHIMATLTDDVEGVAWDD